MSGPGRSGIFLGTKNTASSDERVFKCNECLEVTHRGLNSGL